jgi:DNA-binding FrmR family transcriptional regulator
MVAEEKASQGKALRHRMNRICGQVEGLRKMIEEGRYCVDVLTQIAAARSALDALGVSVLSEHVKHCVAGTAHAHPEAGSRSTDELANEVETVLKRFLR